jgi:hypothetical protein
MVPRRLVVAVVAVVAFVWTAAVAAQVPTESSPSSRPASRPTRELTIKLASGAPAAGAEIRYLAASVDDGQRAFDQLMFELRSLEAPAVVERLFADGWASEARTDADGRFARHRRQAGFGSFETARDAADARPAWRPSYFSLAPARGEWRGGGAAIFSGCDVAADVLTLAPVVVLRTLDAAGRPVPFVPVARTSRWEDGTENCRFEDRTNADGSLRIFTTAPERGAGAETWSVGAYPLGAAAVTAPLDAENPPEAIDLRLPPLSALRVVATRLDGTPFDKPFRVAVFDVKADEARREGTSRTVRGGLGLSEERYCVGESAIDFAHIAPGTSCLVVCRQWERSDWADARVVVESPKAAGETAIATVVFGAPRLTVRARFVGDEHLTGRDGRAELELMDEGGRPVVAWAATTRPSGNGDVAFSFDVAAESRPWRARAKWRFVAGFEPESPPVVEVPAFTADAAGHVDLGDVVFRGRPVLAGGFVVDESGVPIGDARVELQAARPDGVFEKRDPELGFTHVRTSADGAFSLRGRASPAVETAVRPSRRLAVTAPGYLDSTVPCRFGDERHRIALRRAGSVAARFRFDVGRDADATLNNARGIRPRFRLAVRGAPAAPLADADGVAWVVADADGGVRFDGLAPGIARVEAWILDGDKPFLAVDDVRIVAGDVAAPPALQDVDVGQLLPKALLRVVDERGAPIVGARVFALRAMHDFWSETHVGRSGEASTYVGATPMAVVVAADGRWTRETTLGVGRLDVALPPAGSGATVRARVENAAEAAAAGLRLTLRPERFDPRSAPGDLAFAHHPVNGELQPAAAVPDAEGRAAFRLFAAGSWRLTASAEVGTSGLQWIELGPAATTTAVDVVEREAVYEAVVRIDVAAAVRAVREAERR